MSRTIDERVVSMQFDNRNFEKNVSDTMSSLDKLEKSLQLDGAAKGLNDVDYAAKKLDFSSTGSAVESLQAKFSALSVMGVTALANITNSAVNAGKRISAALTIDPIKTGLSEYETKINAIQVIQANTRGKNNMDDINAALEDLNVYADKTIYNFAQMTSNIGKFTAQGLDVKQAANAVKGMANLAAASGASAEDMARATYQMSQALGGTIRLMDWNSLRNANMATVELKNTLIDLAKVNGIAIDDMIAKHGTFEQTLSEGWLTGEMFTKAMNIYSGIYSDAELASMGFNEKQIANFKDLAKMAESAATDVKTLSQLWDVLKETAQSGWTQSWELIFGDFNEAKTMWTGVYKVISGMLEATAKSRNDLLKGWKKEGGRDMLLDSLKNSFEAVLSVINPVKEALREIFPPITVKQLVGITKGLKEFTSKLKLSEKSSENLKRTFKGLFAVIDIIRKVVFGVIGLIGKLLGGVGGLGGGILGITAKIGDLLVKLNEFISRSANAVKTSKVFQTVLSKVSSVVGKLVSAFKRIVSDISGVFGAIGETISGFGDSVSSAFNSASDSLSASVFVRVLEGVKNALVAIFGGIVDATKAISTRLGDFLGAASFADFMDIVKSFIASGVGIGFVKLLKMIREGLSALFSGDSLSVGFGAGLKNILGIVDDLRGALKAYQADLQANRLIKIAGAIAILAAAVFVLSRIEKDKMYDAIAGIGSLFAMLVATMRGLKGVKGSTSGILTMSVSILILASAMKKIAGIETDKMAIALLGIAGLAEILIITAKQLGSGGNAVIKGSAQMIIFAAALKVMASVCKDMSELSWEGLGKSILGVAGLSAILVATAKILGSGGNATIKGAVGMIAFAAALKIMASVCKDISDLSWGDLQKGALGIAALAEIIVITAKLLSNGGNATIKGATGMVIFAAALKVMASAVKDIASMKWESLARGLAGLAGSLTAIVVALKFMPPNMPSMAAGLLILSSALVILASALTKMGGMTWEGIAKSIVALGASLAVLAVGLRAMSGTLSGSGALLVAAISLSVLSSVLTKLGKMSWSGIAKGLIVIAASFVILGVAGAVLGPLVPTILGLAGSLALIGAAVALAGVGLAAAGAGMISFAAGLAALVSVLSGSMDVVQHAAVVMITGFATGLVKGLKILLLSVCDLIIEGAPAIGKALTELLEMMGEVVLKCSPTFIKVTMQLVGDMLKALADRMPDMADSFFRIFKGVLDALTNNISGIVDAGVAFVTNLLIAILDSLGENIPKIVSAGVRLIFNLLSGIGEELSSLDVGSIIGMTKFVGLMAGVMLELAVLGALAPAASVGVLAFGALVSELALVLAAVGAFAQIPGLSWLINEGGGFLKKVGTAIGQFVGGIAGGIAQGFVSSLPDVGLDLSAFMRNLKPFIEGASEIDDSVTHGIKSLVNVILTITGANILKNILSFVSGGSAIEKFSEELPILGNGLREFSDSVAGVSPENIVAASNAAKALCEMTKDIPNEGGVLGWLVGENSIAKFGDELPVLGEGLRAFSDSVAGISPENIVAASTAAKALANMTASIPNEGGVVAWFAGENSISKFAEEIVVLGEGIVGFGKAVADVTPATIIAGAEAAKALAEMTQVIPNEGGVKAWFTGENSITKFAKDIVKLGDGLLGFSVSVSGIVPTNVLAGANAAKALAEMTQIIPNEGGIKAWFTGDNSITNFASQLPTLGLGLLGFSVATMGIVPENIVSAANAAKALAEMTNTLPNEGGIKSWFTGENSIASFAHQLPVLGQGLNSFSVSVMGIVPENIMAAANAAKTLAEMTSVIPNEGGIKAWFTGESSISSFASQLPILGLGLQAFSTSVAGINIESVNSAANAAKTLAGITQVIPNEGGVKAWFTGETSIANFATQLPILGQGLADFSTAVNGINPDNVTSAANAAKALAEMTAVIPKEGGIKAWFTGETSIANFADKLPTLGKGLKGFSESVTGINTENVTAAASAAKSLGEMTSTIPKNTDRIAEFGTNLVSFGKKLSSFFTNTKSITADAVATTKKALDSVDDISSINSSGVKSAATAITDMAKSLKELSKVPKDCTSKFQKALKELGETSVDSLVKALKEAKDDTTKAGEDAMKGFIEGIKSMSSKVETACEDIAADGAAAANNKVSSFESAGKAMAEGLANGISANSYMAKAKAKAMAEAAVEAARKALAINSPSKVFRSLGYSVPEGFAMGIDKLGSLVKDSSVSMADTAIGAVSKSIARIAGVVNSDMDTQPTIRPVLDLSDIKSGAGTIGDILDTNSSVGILANVGSISAMMNRRGQNGNNSDVVSAINGLRKDLGNVGNTTNIIDGVTYDDGSNINDAVQKIVRAARIEGRV